MSRMFGVPIRINGEKKTRKRIRKKKSGIWLNEDLFIEIKRSQQNRFSLVGESGGGKSYCAGLLLNQYNNVIFIDPENEFKTKTLEEIDKENDIEMAKEWTIINLEDLKINVNDISVEGLQNIFYKKSVGGNDVKLNNVLWFFLTNTGLTKQEFNDSFSDTGKALLMEKIRLESFIDFDNKSKAIQYYMKGKFIFLTAGSNNDYVLPFFLESILTYRRKVLGKHKLSSREKTKNLEEKDKIVFEDLILAFDEAHKFFPQSGYIRQGMIDLLGRARKLFISVLLSTAIPAQIPQKASSNITDLLVFRTIKNPKEVLSGKISKSSMLDSINKNFGLRLVDEDFIQMPEYSCYYYSLKTGVSGNYLPEYYVGKNIFYEKNKIKTKKPIKRVFSQIKNPFLLSRVRNAR